LHLLRYTIGLKNSRHFFNQSEVKPKPIVTRSHTFSRALRQLHVISSNFDWFTLLSVSFVIGQSDYFGFGFTALIENNCNTIIGFEVTEFETKSEMQ